MAEGEYVYSETPVNMLRVSYTNKATIPTGVPYENQSPCYTITNEVPVAEVSDSQEVAEEQFKWIKTWVDGKIKDDMEAMAGCREDKGLTPNMYRIIDNKRVPRVTAIITPDRPPIPFIDDHAELGNKLDEMAKIYVETGIWAYDDFKDKGNIKDTWDDVYLAMSAWIEKYSDCIEFQKHSIPVHNKLFNFSGELDAIGVMKKDTILEGSPTFVQGSSFVADFKKKKVLDKASKERFFMQISAYISSLDTDVSSMLVCSPFNNVLISHDIDMYFAKFLVKRGEFKQRFGI